MLGTEDKESTRLEQQNKEMKAKVKEMEGLVARLRAEISALEAKSELQVDKKALEVELKMRGLVEEAYEKGFNSCKAQFVALKELQSTLAL